MKVGAFAAVAIVLLAGCSGSSGDDKSETTTAPTSSSSSSTSTTPTSSTTTDPGTTTTTSTVGTTTTNAPTTSAPPTQGPSSPWKPHVIVAVPDSGINPYHSIYRRPALTEHPCTYIQGFPCDIQELRLTLGSDYAANVAADAAVWDAVVPGQWYWIPGTVFVAVSCETGTSYRLGKCIFNDHGLSDGGHGTGSTSSVVSENPDVLIAFREGGPDTTPFRSADIPVDVYSVSWGFADPVVGLSIPLPTPGCVTDVKGLYVKSSGNEPGTSILLDCWAGKPELIAVGGASASGNSQYAASGKDMDIVSYYCRPTATTGTMDGYNPSHCGTSFAAPTAAGALSKVIYQVRVANDYTGSIAGSVLEPTSGLTIASLRTAMNLTASYNPSPEYATTATPGVPLNPAAPYTQWGWGFYDGRVADATIAHLLDGVAASKSVDCVTYMEALYQERELIW